MLRILLGVKSIFKFLQGFSFPLFEGAFIQLDLGNVFTRKNLSGM